MTNDELIKELLKLARKWEHYNIDYDDCEYASGVEAGYHGASEKLLVLIHRWECSNG